MDATDLVRRRLAGPLLLSTVVLFGCGADAPAPNPAAAIPPPGQPAPVAPPSPAPPTDPAPVASLPTGYVLTWSEEFDGDALDPATWQVRVAPRGDALPTPDALEVRDGVLRFRTFTGTDGVPRTGFISTEGGRFEATYGYFEARIRFHGAPGQWCAFWLMSPTIGVPLGDPARAGTEIDVVEHRFVDESGWQLRDWVGQNVLWDGYGPHRKNQHHVSPLPDGGPVDGEWHTFAVLWDEGGYRFFVDANELWRSTAPVSQRSEYVLLTCEVLDDEWAGSIPEAGYGSRETSTSGMEVDWVRVWQRR